MSFCNVWNLLSSMNGLSYRYNSDGVRFKKVINGLTTTYYLDGEKILGEDRSDGTQLRYFYDIDGLCGIKYNDTHYKCVRNAYGDIVMLTNNGLPTATTLTAIVKVMTWTGMRIRIVISSAT